MPAVVCENISCGSPPYLLNPVPPNEKPSCLNQYPVRVVSLDASFLAVYTVTKFLRRTIPLGGNLANPARGPHSDKGTSEDLGMRVRQHSNVVRVDLVAPLCTVN